MSTPSHASWPPRPPVDEHGMNPIELRCYLPEAKRPRRGPLTMPVLVLAVLTVAALIWFVFYRIST